MNWLNQTVADLGRHEGFREFAYPDPLSTLGRKYKDKKYQWGFVPGDILLAKYGERAVDGLPWTVGYGFTRGVNPASRMNRQFADQRLAAEAVEHSKLLDKIIPSWVKMPLFAQTVLANMAFNLGTRLVPFRPTLALFEAGDFKAAGARLRKSVWFKQVGARAEELVRRLETGVIEPQHRVN